MDNDDPLLQRVYYSQNREDLILEAFFPNVSKGFYVDVGASDPVKFSVTKLFYDKGWRGLNIEPLQQHYESLKTQRPRDINLNLGVGRTSGTLLFHEYVGDGLSTFSPETTKEYAKVDDALYAEAKQYEVKVLTLKQIFAEHSIKSIHFLKVDVEGFEYDVLAGNDWSAYRPEVICIEANHIKEDWRPLLKSNGYELTFFDGLNEYYTDSKTDRHAKFDFVYNVVLKKDGGIRASDFGIIVGLKTEVQDAQKLTREAHVELQAALSANARQDKLYQAILTENHNNHIRAAVAERALRSPLAFIKYQLKRVHHFILRLLSPRKKIPEYTEAEKLNKNKALNRLADSQSDKQRLSTVKELAETETDRLERLYGSNYQPLALKIYLRAVGFIKLLRLRRNR